MLIDVLTHAEIGEVTPRSWAYWHYRLGLATLGTLPPMPRSARNILNERSSPAS